MVFLFCFYYYFHLNMQQIILYPGLFFNQSWRTKILHILQTLSYRRHSLFCHCHRKSAVPEMLELNLFFYLPHFLVFNKFLNFFSIRAFSSFLALCVWFGSFIFFLCLFIIAFISLHLSVVYLNFSYRTHYLLTTSL